MKAARVCYSMADAGFRIGDRITFGDDRRQWIIIEADGESIICRPARWYDRVRWGTVVGLAVILALGFFFFSCITAEEEARPAARVEVPADTCRPPACYSDPRPPGPPR